MSSDYQLMPTENPKVGVGSLFYMKVIKSKKKGMSNTPNAAEYNTL